MQEYIFIIYIKGGSCCFLVLTMSVILSDNELALVPRASSSRKVDPNQLKDKISTLRNSWQPTICRGAKSIVTMKTITSGKMLGKFTPNPFKSRAKGHVSYHIYV